MKDLVFFAKGMLVVFLLLGCGALYLAQSQAQQATRLQTEGVSAKATIAEKFVQASTHTSSSDQRTRGGTDHVVVYRFAVEGRDAPHSKRERLPETIWNQVSVGQQVTVRYWSEDPNVSTIQDDGFARSAEFLSTSWKVLFGLAASCALFARLGSPKPPRPGVDV